MDYIDFWKKSIMHPEIFWESVAEELFWKKKWEKPLDGSNPPFYRWFVGGVTNITYNILERHSKDKPAIIWFNSELKSHIITYGELSQEVNKWACLLKKVGVQQGDRVTIYMPMIPQAAYAMLAVAKLGAVHNVVFSGFSVRALQERILDSGSKIVLTVDAMRRRGKVLKLAEIALKAAGNAKVVIFNYLGEKIDGDFVEAENLFEKCEIEYAWVKSDDPLFILYTSGTTGKPKGIYHGHGSYMVWAYAHTKWFFGFEKKDILFSTSDIGWINGHTYGLYGPLLNGSTVVWYEDAPDYPHPGAWWEIVDRSKATFIWLSPTAVRLLMRYGEEWPAKYSLENLKMVVSAGEILGKEAWKWLKRHICKNRQGCHVVETWGQTENSGFIAAPGGYGVGGIRYKDGSVGLPYPGIDVRIYDDNGKELPPGAKGHVVVLPPTPPAFALGIWGNPARWIEAYWSKFPGVYYTGDVGIKDEEGYIYILGRADDVIKIAGHRLSPAEVENIVATYPGVVEAAAVGVPDEIKGATLAIFVVPKEGVKVNPQEVVEFLKREFGPVAVVSKVYVVNKLPKTRTGKIMRRVLRALISGGEIGDISTLEEETSIDEVKRALEEVKIISS